ncbi:MAG: hypothetical protein WCK98_01595 [bacterium]
MNILIFASDSHFEEEKLLNKAREFGFSAQVILLPQTQIIHSNSTKIFYGKNDITKILKESVVIFRRTRNNYPKAVSIVNYFWQNNIKFTDSFESIISNLDKSLYLPSIESELVPQPKTIFFCSNLDLISSNIGFPLIIKPSNGRHGEGVELVIDRSNLDKKLNHLNESLIIQEQINIAKEYRIFIVGDKVLGVVRKIPPLGSIVANYSSGAEFVSSILPKAVLEETIRISKNLGIEISGYDIAEDIHGKYFTLEINRCPEFKAFEQATKVDVSKEILEYIKNKYIL